MPSIPKNLITSELAAAATAATTALRTNSSNQLQIWSPELICTIVFGCLTAVLGVAMLWHAMRSNHRH